MQRDTYYAGKKQEHWDKGSPNKSMNQAIPDKLCPDCGNPCLIKESNSVKNPGRMFYKCPLGWSGFFQWCDDNRQPLNTPHSPKMNQTRTDEIEGCMQSSYPECACGAGICKLETAPSEKNSGRKFFICPVKKGQGACNFRQWQDSLETDTDFNLNDSVDLDDISGKSSSRVGDLCFEDLSLSGERASVSAKPGKCYRCGLEGHWSRDCLKPSNSPSKSACYKCGEVGHWAKYCSSKVKSSM